MKPTLLLLLLLYGSSCNLFGQEDDKFSSFYWPKYNNVLNFDNEWTLITELESLRSFSPDRQRQMLARTTLSKEISSKVLLGLGLAYNRTLDTETDLWEPEWRPHQQAELLLQFDKLLIDQRVRIEQQFTRQADPENQRLEQQYTLSPRARYQFQFTYITRGEPGEKGSRTAFLRNEVYVLPFSEQKFFNLNRSTLGMVFQPFANFSFEAAYMFTILQGNADAYNYRHIVGITIIQSINL